MDTFQAPATFEHTDHCRVELFRWRLRNRGLPAVDDVTDFPCVCGGGRALPWRLVDAIHPSWCIVRGEHDWTRCTFVPEESS